MNILLKGYYGRNNFGDDALLFAASSMIEEVMEQKCISPYSILLERKNFAHYLRQQTNYKYSQLGDELIDLEVLGGGTQFFSFREATIKEKVTYWLDYLSRDKSAAFKEILNKLFKSKPQAKNVPKIALGVGIGVINSVDYKNLLIKQLGEFLTLCLRDQYSIKKYNEMITDYHESQTKIRYVSDICYSMYASLTEPYFLKNIKNYKNEKVGIVLRDFKWAESDILNSDILNKLKRKFGAENLIFYSFSSSEDKKVTSLAQSLGIQVKVWNEDYVTIGEMCESLGTLDLLVTSRFHGGVFATLLGVRQLLINIDVKLAQHHLDTNSSTVLWSNGSENTLEKSLDELIAMSPCREQWKVQRLTLINRAKDNLCELRLVVENVISN